MKSKSSNLLLLMMSFFTLSCGEWEEVKPISELKFDGSVDQDAFSCSKITIIAYNKDGEEQEANSSQTISLTATGGGFHPESEANCQGDEITEISLPSRSSRVTVRYSANIPGNYDLGAEGRNKNWTEAETTAIIHNPLN